MSHNRVASVAKKVQDITAMYEFILYSWRNANMLQLVELPAMLWISRV